MEALLFTRESLVLNGPARLKVLRINLEGGKPLFRPYILRNLNCTGRIGSYPASMPFAPSSKAGRQSFSLKEGDAVGRIRLRVKSGSSHYPISEEVRNGTYRTNYTRAYEYR